MDPALQSTLEVEELQEVVLLLRRSPLKLLLSFCPQAFPALLQDLKLVVQLLWKRVSVWSAGGL